EAICRSALPQIRPMADSAYGGSATCGPARDAMRIEVVDGMLQAASLSPHWRLARTEGGAWAVEAEDLACLVASLRNEPPPSERSRASMAHDVGTTRNRSEPELFFHTSAQEPRRQRCALVR